MDANITSAYTQVGDVKIHYLTAGEGEPVLLLHGWPTSAYLWRNILPIVAQNYQVIAMDLPGFGKSDKRLQDSFSFRYYDRVISGFLENLDIDKITLGVHDLGGPIGIYWLTQHMERVDRLILFNTLVYPKFSTAVKVFALATVLPIVKTVLTSPFGLKRAIYFGVNQKQKLNQEIIQNYQEPFTDKTSRKVLLKSIQRLSLKAYEEMSVKLKEFKGAVQILYGEKDKILPMVGDTMKRVKQDLPQSRVQSLPHCGHFLQEEEPEILGNAILEFMQSS